MALDKLTEEFCKGLVCAKEIKDSLSKAALSLKAHVANVKREALRKEKDAKARREKAEKDVVSTRAKQAAERLKKQEADVPPFFKITQENWDDAIKNNIAKEIPKGASVGVENCPALIEGWDKIDEFLAQDKVQIALGNFGGQYKKFGADALKTDGRTQHPVYDGEGLAECGNLFEKLRELLPKDTVVSEADLPNAFANVLRHYWFYGFSSQMASIVSCPTGVPMIKLLAAGEVRWVVFEPVTTATALQDFGVAVALANLAGAEMVEAA